MQSLTEIRALLDARGLSPRHRHGQNFLIDQNLIRRLVDAAGMGQGSAVLEIGPGTGTLTDELLDRGCAVLACEIDAGLCELLRERYAARPGFSLVEGDCLAGKRAFSPELSRRVRELARAGEFSLVSNLPYAAGTPVMINLLADYPACRGMFVTIQREVADRLLVGPGSKDYGPLAILAHAVAESRVIARLPPECFWPRPKVESAMVALTRRARPLTDDPRGLFEFARSLFTQRRKQLGSILGREHPVPPGVTHADRAENLAPEQILALSRVGGVRASGNRA